MPTSRLHLILAAVAYLTLCGCATKKYVRTEVTASEERATTRAEAIESQLEETQSRIAEEQEAQDREIGELSKTAREALDRAVAAGELAEGRFLYETVLTDDQVRFGFESAELSSGAAEALDRFAAGLVERNENVFIEIQGHTDATGPDAYNLDLGHERAEAVRRYLNRRHGIALHRMSVISYGESEPVADNGTREGRAVNRRVVLVVLQ